MDERFIVIAVRTAILFIIAAAGISLVHAQGNRNLSGSDEEFLLETYKDGLAAVDMAEAAMARAKNPIVKDFARSMVRLHSASNEKLMRLATGVGLNIPQEMRKENREVSEKLSRVSDPDFDRAYIDYELEYYRKQLKDYSKEVSKGTNSDIKTFVFHMTPELERRMSTAKAVGKAIS